MLYLDNSALACIPLARSKSAPKGVSSMGGRCEACGIEASCGLEKHDGKTLCPFCHLTQHLYHASRLRAGAIIWLPKISQEALNRFVSTMFMLLAAPESHKAAVSATLNKMKSIYKEGFEQDCQAPYEQFLRQEDAGSGANRKRPLNFPFPITDPLLIADSIDGARAKDKIGKNTGNNDTTHDAARLGVKETDGLRILFSPEPFRPLIKAWLPEFYAQRPPEDWLVEATENESAET